MREIARLEPVPRGAYTGSLGYVSGAGSDFNILIRSLTFAARSRVCQRRRRHRHRERRHRGIHGDAAQGRGAAACAGQRQAGSRGRRRLGSLRAWRPPRPRPGGSPPTSSSSSHDSFSYNIVNYLRMLGAACDRRRYGAYGAAGELQRRRRIAVAGGCWPAPLTWSPAPVPAIRPAPAVCSTGSRRRFRAASLPGRLPWPSGAWRRLGAPAWSGRRTSARRRPSSVTTPPTVSLPALPSPARFTRYHSLCLAGLPPSWCTGLDRRRPEHGRRPPAPARLGRAVSPREHAQPARPRPAGQLPEVVIGR